MYNIPVWLNEIAIVIMSLPIISDRGGNNILIFNTSLNKNVAYYQTHDLLKEYHAIDPECKYIITFTMCRTIL